MDCTRLDYYLQKIDVNIDENFKVYHTVKRERTSDLLADEIIAKLDKNKKLRDLADATMLAGGIVTAVSLVPAIDKAQMIGMSLFELYGLIDTIGLENSMLISSGGFSILALLDEMDLLLDGIGFAADALDVTEAIFTGGLSLAASWVAKKASEKANEEKEYLLQRLKEKNQDKIKMLKVLSKETDRQKRKAELVTLVNQLTLAKVF